MDTAPVGVSVRHDTPGVTAVTFQPAVFLPAASPAGSHLLVTVTVMGRRKRYAELQIATAIRLPPS
jgi:hypothetical protein